MDSIPAVHGRWKLDGHASGSRRPADCLLHDVVVGSEMKVTSLLLISGGSLFASPGDEK